MNSFDIIAVFGNNVECCFDKVERCFSIVAGVDGLNINTKTTNAEAETGRVTM